MILFAWGVNAAIGYRRLSQQEGRGEGAIKKGRRRRRRKVLQSPRRSGRKEKVARAKPTYSPPGERVFFFQFFRVGVTNI